MCHEHSLSHDEFVSDKFILGVDYCVSQVYIFTIVCFILKDYDLTCSIYFFLTHYFLPVVLYNVCQGAIEIAPTNTVVKKNQTATLICKFDTDAAQVTDRGWTKMDPNSGEIVSRPYVKIETL